MIIIVFKDNNGKYLKEWPNWTGVVPQINDTVLIHFGDNNEKEEKYKIINRIIDGTHHSKIILICEPCI